MVRGYVYFENEPGRRSAAKLLTKDEARRIAVNIGNLSHQPITTPMTSDQSALCLATGQWRGHQGTRAVTPTGHNWPTLT
jgi:hypothetical protein